MECFDQELNQITKKSMEWNLIIQWLNKFKTMSVMLADTKIGGNEVAKMR